MKQNIIFRTFDNDLDWPVEDEEEENARSFVTDLGEAEVCIAPIDMDISHPTDTEKGVQTGKQFTNFY
jgi:hypothetical protein